MVQRKLFNRSRVTDMENKLIVIKEERRGEEDKLRDQG